MLTDDELDAVVIGSELPSSADAEETEERVHLASLLTARERLNWVRRMVWSLGYWLGRTTLEASDRYPVLTAGMYAASLEAALADARKPRNPGDGTVDANDAKTNGQTQGNVGA